MISTSEIKISVVIDAKYVELAVRVAARRLHRGRGGLMTAIQIYDTTLRDGCQAEDITLTLDDKLRIAERLDAFGIHYIEGGWPGSNPRDEEFFRVGPRRSASATPRSPPSARPAATASLATRTRTSACCSPPRRRS